MTASKVTLGKRPGSIKASVIGPMADGSTAVLSVSYKYRTRTEYGELLEKHQRETRTRSEDRLRSYLAAVDAAKKAGADIPSPMDDGVSRSTKEQVAADARFLLDIADGWDLDIPYDLDGLIQLCDECPGVATAMIEKYRIAVNEGRLGN